MPSQGGLSTIPALRSDWPALKILAISGADSVGPFDMTERATAVGADAFLQKRFEATELLRIIETLLPKPPMQP